MLIKYCSSCVGEPYTKDISVSCCPICGAELKTAMSDEADLVFRDMLPGGGNYNSDLFGSEDDTFIRDEAVPFDFFDDSSNVPDASDRGYSDKPADAFTFSDHSKNDAFVEADKSNVGNTITGIVSNYSCDENYRRYFPVKLVDALIYKQRFSDCCHRFTVRVNKGTDSFGSTSYADIPVNMYGIISQGINLNNNQVVQANGKYKNGVLMAKDVKIISNSSCTSVKTQHSAKAILYGFLAIVALVFLIYIGASSNGGFFQNIGTFFKTWLISAVVITVLYFLLSLSKIGIMARMAMGNRRKFPLVGILLTSLIIALVFINSFGLGASVGGLLSGLFSSVITIVIFIAVLLLIFKLLF